MPKIKLIESFTISIKDLKEDIKVFDKTQLVEICKHIDIDDAEMDKIIDNGTFRKIISKEKP